MARSASTATFRTTAVPRLPCCRRGRIATQRSKTLARGPAWRSRTRSTPPGGARASCALQMTGRIMRRPRRSPRSPSSRSSASAMRRPSGRGGPSGRSPGCAGSAPPACRPGRAERPLAGVRVLDLTRVLAGPTCAKSLAEHGADVLKISAAHLPDSGLVEMDTGIGKLSARLDLRTHEGAARLRELVKSADVFSQSYRPGALAGRGFAPEALAALRPGIVCVSLSAWGETGPWRSRRGFDSIVQAVSGMAHASGDANAPKLLPVSAIDYVSGYLMAYGATVALERRAREGGSWLVRVALARVGQWIVDLGTVDASGVAADVPADELARYSDEMDTPLGRIRYLRPVIQLSHTPGRWTRPPVPLGAHPAQWP